MQRGHCSRAGPQWVGLRSHLHRVPRQLLRCVADVDALKHHPCCWAVDPSFCQQTHGTVAGTPRAAQVAHRRRASQPRLIFLRSACAPQRPTRWSNFARTPWRGATPFTDNWIFLMQRHPYPRTTGRAAAPHAP